MPGPVTPHALPAPRASWAFRQPAAALWLRPWFDRLALRFIARTYLPLSRGWAAAALPEATPEGLAAGLDLPPGPQLAEALAAVQAARQAYEEAAQRWSQAFFSGFALSEEARVGAELARAAAAHRFMAARQRFAPWRRRLTPVRWAVPSRAALAERHGRTVADGPPLAPRPAAVQRSAFVPAAAGREYWLTFRSQRLGDAVTARVTEAAEGPAQATLIALHGICMESEMWRPTVDPLVGLTRAGWRVVRPEGPWHGRRRLPGYYGGEPAMAWGLEGFLTLFQAWVAEVGALIAWARGQGPQPVVLCGTSLGALAAQLYASQARHWPASYTPEALLLITTSCDLLGAAHDGALARRIGAPAALAGAGWTPEALARWMSLLEPGESAVPPERTLLLLGSADRVTPYAGGLELARRWGLPPQNVFRRWRGHFSTALALGADRAVLRRLVEVVS